MNIISEFNELLAMLQFVKWDNHGIIDSGDISYYQKIIWKGDGVDKFYRLVVINNATEDYVAIAEKIERECKLLNTEVSVIDSFCNKFRK